MNELYIYFDTQSIVGALYALHLLPVNYAGRAAPGKHELDQLSAEREKLNLDIHKILDMQTLSNIAGDKSSTIVFPLPMDLLTPLVEAMRKPPDG